MGDVRPWSELAARGRIEGLVKQCGLKFSETKYKPLEHAKGIVSYRTSGLRLTQHRNTWKRKRESVYLVRIEYVLDNCPLMVHVEPWVSFPSDLLISKLMLLPPEVTKDG